MKRELVNKILNDLSDKSVQYAVRDISLLSASIFNQTHLSTLKNISGVNFYISFWFNRPDGQIVWYHPGREYNLLIKKGGTKCLKKPEFAKEISKNLIKLTDLINNFISKNKRLNDLINHWNDFYILYRDFFAYHQIVYWSSEYLVNRYGTNKKTKRTVKILDHAYKYNENVIPNVDKYFRNFKVSHLANTEMINAADLFGKVKKKRSILLFKGKTAILPYDEANQLNKAIIKKYQKYLNNPKLVKGLSVGKKGIFKGKVRLVSKLNKLKESKKNDILVTTQTRPQYNAAIKKVKVIITDEGGLLCHASMLAREFKIPCIVGTKVATQIFKTGDRVEVDADKGVVRKI